LTAADFAAADAASGIAAGMAGQPLHLDHKSAIERALERLTLGTGERCLSDHAFSNLYLFRQAHAYRYLPGEYPCVSGRTYDGMRHLMPLFALHQLPAAELQALLGDHDGFYPVAQQEMEMLDPGLYLCTQSRDDADYLYAGASFRDYRGRALSKKRNLMKQLLAAAKPSCTPYAPDLMQDALAVLDGWMQDKSKGKGEADQAACVEALQHAVEFGLEGFVHYVQGRPAGFLLAQEIQPAVFVMRFAKGLDAFKGIYQYMFHHFCTHFERPVAWLNFEQDMGLANFRRTKLSYQPAALLGKFRVRPRVL
jgi:hypothetical protein